MPRKLYHLFSLVMQVLGSVEANGSMVMFAATWSDGPEAPPFTSFSRCVHIDTTQLQKDVGFTPDVHLLNIRASVPLQRVQSKEGSSSIVAHSSGAQPQRRRMGGRTPGRRRSEYCVSMFAEAENARGSKWAQPLTVATCMATRCTSSLELPPVTDVEASG